MSKEKSIYDGLPYLYAEQLKGKRITLTIKRVQDGIKFYSPAGEALGHNIHFAETDKLLGVTGSTVKRQLFVATGTEDIEAMKGIKIILYPVPSTKSATGEAIRIAPAKEEK